MSDVITIIPATADKINKNTFFLFFLRQPPFASPLMMAFNTCFGLYMLMVLVVFALLSIEL